MKTYSLDTESYYDGDISITTMGAWHYTRASDCYMVTVAGEDGFEYAGHPKDFDWSLLRGARIVMANAGYDLTVLDAEAEKGVIPADLGFAEVVDVLDMSRYLGRPGNLKGAVESLFKGLLGEDGGIDKSTRANMKGKRWESMTPEFREEVTNYALEDARWTLRLWQVYGDKWPWHEQQLSRQTREMGMRGVPVDVEAAQKAKTHLEGLIWAAEQKIPWAKEEGAKILSPKRLAEECRSVGLVPPKSLAQDSEECAEWEDKYGTDYPWIGAMRDWRRCNMMLKKVETFIKRTKPDGWMPYGLKYFGAGSTGRWSGDSGLNLQNLPRAEMYGVDMRGFIKAPPGFKFIAPDLSAIEPRCLSWMVQDRKTLDVLASGADVYEAHARATLGYEDPRPLKDVDTELRRLAKARVLGCGYGCGPAKFVTVAKVMAGLVVTAREAEQIVDSFRRSNKPIVDLWKTLDKAMRQRAGRGEFSMELPSGRVINYWDVSTVGDGLSAITCRNGKMMRSKFYGGLLTENSVQATAREVFGEKLLNIEAAGIPILFHVHDEVICMVPEESAEQDLAKVVSIMSETPDWMPGLPLAAEGSVLDKYGK